MRDLVCDRVSCFETDVPHTFNNSVMAYVTLFTARNRCYLAAGAGARTVLLPIFEKYLAQYQPAHRPEVPGGGGVGADSDG
ncbi:MAG: hypothetical protein WKG07_16140 [Hymenobacter sp.]